MPAPAADPAGAGDPPRDGCFFSTTGKSTFFFTETMGNERPPPLMDPLAPEYFEDIAKFYLEAARRLPMDAIPGLARCISRSGLAVGLCDPVTNILLTTISTFAKEKDHYVRPVEHSADAVEQTRDKFTFADGARRSRAGLIGFMLCYFRYLTEPQAKQCLAMAGHDLPLAVMLVEQGCFRGHRCPLAPDAARTKAALKQAARHARGCSAPDELVRLMTSRDKDINLVLSLE
uniref:PIR2-like helical domain-containing protein n=1 Tax=Aegilops tauschii TaxID=37682 RepID=R7WBT0_AEGTA